MTIQELYQTIGGNYDQALRVLRVEKLVDKHIRKLTQNGVVEKLLQAGERMDPTEMFETAHAAKGVTANLGLTRLSEGASAVAEEFRPGNSRTMTDEELSRKMGEIADLYARTVEGIRQYAGE